LIDFIALLDEKLFYQLHTNGWASHLAANYAVPAIGMGNPGSPVITIRNT